MIVQLAADHLIGDLHDHLADFRVHLAEIHVRLRGRLLDDAEGADHRFRLLFPADLEVSEAALGLGAPVDIIGDLDGAHRIGFSAGIGHGAQLLDLLAAD